jgi:hypothetical protein
MIIKAGSSQRSAVVVALQLGYIWPLYTIFCIIIKQNAKKERLCLYKASKTYIILFTELEPCLESVQPVIAADLLLAE